jgi:hypothetical protein
VRGGHRVPAIGGVELGGQLTEPGRQDRRVLGAELPGHRELCQVTVRILQRDAGLARAAQPVQGHHPRSGTLVSGHAVSQLGEQFLPPG